jgi:hypothetical protein
MHVATPMQSFVPRKSQQQLAPPQLAQPPPPPEVAAPDVAPPEVPDALENPLDIPAEAGPPVDCTDEPTSALDDSSDELCELVLLISPLACTLAPAPAPLGYGCSSSEVAVAQLTTSANPIENAPILCQTVHAIGLNYSVVHNLRPSEFFVAAYRQMQSPPKSPQTSASKHDGPMASQQQSPPQSAAAVQLPLPPLEALRPLDDGPVELTLVLVTEVDDACCELLDAAELDEPLLDAWLTLALVPPPPPSVSKSVCVPVAQLITSPNPTANAPIPWRRDQAMLENIPFFRDPRRSLETRSSDLRAATPEYYR